MWLQAATCRSPPRAGALHNASRAGPAGTVQTTTAVTGAGAGAAAGHAGRRGPLGLHSLHLVSEGLHMVPEAGDMDRMGMGHGVVGGAVTGVAGVRGGEGGRRLDLHGVFKGWRAWLAGMLLHLLLVYKA